MTDAPAEIYRCPAACTDPSCECRDPARDLYWFGCHERLSGIPAHDISTCEGLQQMSMADWLRARGHRVSWWGESQGSAAELVGEKIFVGHDPGRCLAQAVRWSEQHAPAVPSLRP